MATPRGHHRSARRQQRWTSDLPLSKSRKLGIFLVLSLGLFLAAAEYTMLNVGLPQLSRALSATESALALIVDAFGLIQAGFIVPGGAIGDHIGRRKAFLIGMLTIAGGAIWAARAGTTLELILARGVMGLGAALSIPCFLAILRVINTSPQERARDAEAYSAVIGMGVLSGPVFGGWVIGDYTWRWVFWATCGLAVIAAVCSVVLPETRDRKQPLPDLRAAVLGTVGLGLLLWAVIEGPSQGWGNRTIVAALLIGSALIGGLVWWQLKAKRPLIDRRFTSSRRVWAALATIVADYVIVGGTLFVLSPQLQVVLGYGPFAAGLRQLPAAVGAVVGSLLAQATRKLHLRIAPVVAAGFALLGVAELLLARVGVQSGYGPLFWTLLLGGVGWGVVSARCSGVIMGTLPEEGASAAAAVDEMFRQVALIIGVALASTLVNIVYRSRMGTAVLGLPPAQAAQIKGSAAAGQEVAAGLGPLGGPLAEAVRVAYTDATNRAGLWFTVTAVTAAVLAAVVAVRARLTTRKPGRVGPTQVAVANPLQLRERHLFAEAVVAVDWTRSDVTVPLIMWRVGLQSVVDLSHEAPGRAVLPRRITAADRAALEREGVRFAEPISGDSDFCRALLPAGWELVLRWESRRIELLDQRRRMRAVITYRRAYGAERREARIAVAVRAHAGLSRDPGSQLDDTRDALRRWEAEDVDTQARTNPPNTPEDLDRLYTVAGLRGLASPPDGWMMLPTGLWPGDVLPGPAGAAVVPLNGDALFSWVQRPADWRLRFNAEEFCVDIFDSAGTRVAVLLYETSLLGDRWACVMPLVEPPAASVPLAAPAASDAHSAVPAL